MSDTILDDQGQEHAGMSKAPRLLYVAFAEPEQRALQNSIASAIRWEAIDWETFAATDFWLSDDYIGCLLRQETTDPRHWPSIMRCWSAWQMHGVGAAVVHRATDAISRHLAEEIGIEVCVQAPANPAADLDSLVKVWLRRRRYRETTLKMMEEIESCLKDRNYQRTRDIIDALVLIDPRKRFYLALLGATMLEVSNTVKAEECLRRALIHWPRSVKAAAILCQLLVDTKRPIEAAELGMRLVDSFGEFFPLVLTHDRIAPKDDDVVENLTETKRLLNKIYSQDSLARFSECYLSALKHHRLGAEKGALFAAIMRRGASPQTPDAIEDLIQDPRGPRSRSRQRQPGDQAHVNSKHFAEHGNDGGGTTPMHGPYLDVTPPHASLSQSAMAGFLAKAAKEDPENVIRNTDGPALVYKMRVFVFHSASNGYRRLAHACTQIGCEIVEGHHDVGATIDRIRSVRVDFLIIWFEEHFEGPIALLRELVASRDLYRMAVWVLSPGHATQTQFSVKARDLFFDANDVVNWQKAQFAEGFNRVLEQRNNPNTLSSVLHTLRKTWAELGSRPLSAEETSGMIARVESSFSKEPERAYWILAEDIVHACARGDIDHAREAIGRMPPELANEHDFQTLRAIVRARREDPKGVALELIESIANNRIPMLESGLRLAQMFSKWDALEALQRLANAMFRQRSNSPPHQAHFVAGIYYRLCGRDNEAAAHALVAIEMAPLRQDYLVEFASSCERRQASRGAEIWEIIAAQGLVPKWYCCYQAGELLIRGGKYARAMIFLEMATEENPTATVCRQLLERAKKLIGGQAA